MLMMNMLMENIYVYGIYFRKKSINICIPRSILSSQPRYRSSVPVSVPEPTRHERAGKYFSTKYGKCNSV